MFPPPADNGAIWIFDWLEYIDQEFSIFAYQETPPRLICGMNPPRVRLRIGEMVEN
jgi:hypothetical protein